MATPLPQQRRTLGRSGLQVSPIGLGCSGFWGHRRFPEADAARVMRAAVAAIRSQRPAQTAFGDGGGSPSH